MTHPAHTLAHAGVARRPGPLGPRRGRGPTAPPPEEVPGDAGSVVDDVLAFVVEHRARLLRVGLHLVVAATPLLAISAHVFGIAPMNVTAGLVVVPLTLLALVLGVFSPAGEERLVLVGAMWGVLATLVYDAVRLDTVYLLGWWGDFIPRVGTWILDADSGSSVVGAFVGYLWRYAGDGGGIGVAFFVLVAATGLRRWGERATVAAAVVFAVFPVWTGLVATVALAPRGQQQMFPLTPATVALSLLGHLVFGLVLGLGCARCRRLEELWPWPPLLDLRRGAVSVAAGAGSSTRRAGSVDDRWGPPALVAGPETDAERTEIRVDRPVPLPRAGLAPRGRRPRGGGPPGPDPVLLPEGRGGWDPAGGRAASLLTGPASGLLRTGARPASSNGTGPRVAGPGSGPPPVGGPRSGPVRLPEHAVGRVPGARSAPADADHPRSAPLPGTWSGPIGDGKALGPPPIPAPGRTGGARPPGRAAAGGPRPVAEGPTSGPVRLADVDVTGPAWSRTVPPAAPDPWLGPHGRAAASSAEPHPDLAPRG